MNSQQRARSDAPYLDAILQLRCAGRARAVDTTEDLSVRFDAMANDTAVAVGTNRRERMDRALEAIENMAFSADYDFKRLIIIVLANLACRHTQFRSRERTLPVVFIFHSRMRFSGERASIINVGYRACALRNSSGLTRDGKLSLVAITAG